MRRLEYVCTACGRPFGRLESARRHVFNPNIHNGQGATITSLTEYALGIKQGRYLPPSYNVPIRILGGGKRSLLQQPPPPPQPPPSSSSGNQRGQKTTNGTETVFDSMHKYANFAHDYKDFNEIMTEQATKAAEMSRLNPLPEYWIGYACDRCFTTVLTPIPFLDSTMTLHQCDPAKVRKIESVKNRDKTFKEARKGFAGRIKLRIDTWTKNSSKYLIAQAISPEFAQQAPAWLKRFMVTLQAGSNHYLNRAIASAKKDGSWIAINDNETLDFLEKTLASVAIFEVKINGNNNEDNNSKNEEEDPASTHEYFLVRIVPPQYVEAKRLNDQIATLTNKFLKEINLDMLEEREETNSDFIGDDDDVKLNLETQLRQPSPNSQDRAAAGASIRSGNQQPMPETMMNEEEGTYTLVKHKAKRPCGFDVHWLLRLKGNPQNMQAETFYWRFLEEPTTTANQNVTVFAGHEKEKVLKARLLCKRPSKLDPLVEFTDTKWMDECCTPSIYQVLDRGTFRLESSEDGNKVFNFKGIKLAGRCEFAISDKNHNLWQFAAVAS
jgi:hypothetical protein